MEYLPYALLGSAASVYFMGTEASKNFLPFIPINTALTWGVFYIYPFSQNPLIIVATSAVVMKLYEMVLTWYAFM